MFSTYGIVFSGYFWLNKRKGDEVTGYSVAYWLNVIFFKKYKIWLADKYQ